MYQEQTLSASQATLVDNGPQTSETTIVSFSRDDTKNTEIYSSDGRLRYTVTTNDQTRMRTLVSRAVPGAGQDVRVVVAEVYRSNWTADRIRIGGNDVTKLGKWLSGCNGKWTDFPVSFRYNSREYTWRTNRARRIALYVDDETDEELAAFQSSRRVEGINGIRILHPARLTLHPDVTIAPGLVDKVVVSLLVVEQELRRKETRYRNSDMGFLK